MCPPMMTPIFMVEPQMQHQTIALPPPCFVDAFGHFAPSRGWREQVTFSLYITFTEKFKRYLSYLKEMLKHFLWKHAENFLFLQKSDVLKVSRCTSNSKISAKMSDAIKGPWKRQTENAAHEYQQGFFVLILQAFKHSQWHSCLELLWNSNPG